MNGPSLVMHPRSRIQGFTLIEMMVTITLFTILMMLAVPSFTQWLRNNQVRSTTDDLQNGLRAAKNHAITQNRRVVFSLVSAAPSLSATADPAGLNYTIRTIPNTGDDSSIHPKYLGGGNIGSSAGNIVIKLPGAGGGAVVPVVCFNSAGRMVTVTTPGTGAECDQTSAIFEVKRSTHASGKDRYFQVRVSSGGLIRMCDPDRTGQVDGC